ncbi:MAG: hypothetical protein N2441_02625 [Rhodocyclaceae bacterium]|nr:hypothetical protein [Rhodocyclaceae bacterium]
MAVRVHTRFHTAGKRSPAAIASVIALLAWKLAVDAINRMRRADYDIAPGRPFYDFVCEFLVFLAVVADRLAYRELSDEERAALISALVRRLSEMVGENRYLLLDEAGAADAALLTRRFVDLYNRRAADYAEFDYGADGPDFAFKRYFASCIREVLPEKDWLWVLDQIMEIEAPEAIKAVEKSLLALLHPEREKNRGRREGVAGE